MGKRAAIFTLGIFCFMLLSTHVKAASAEEVYEVYDMEYSVDIPKEVTETIRAYDNAKKYVSMYTYVVNSEYDIESLTLKQTQIETELRIIESKLLSGYDTPQVELYSLEDEYHSLKTQLENIRSSLHTYSIEMESVTANSVPTYTEYKEAVQTKNDIVARMQIGEVEQLKVPVQSVAKLIKHDTKSTIYKVIEGTGVLSPFNGVVDKVYVDKDYGLCVVFDNYNGIKTYVCNLETVDITEGDTVYQNQRIGYALGSTVLFKMSLSDTFVDISKIFVEELSQ